MNIVSELTINVDLRDLDQDRLNLNQLYTKKVRQVFVTYIPNHKIIWKGFYLLIIDIISIVSVVLMELSITFIPYVQ